VAKGDVPGEWYSPTQPFPLDARGRLFAYDRQGFVEDDLIDFTPELRAEAKQLVSKYRIGPWFTPPVVSKIEGPLATLALGAAGGGTNWPGGSYDPETHILFVSSTKTLSQLGLVPSDPAKTDMQYVQGSAASGVRSSGGAGSNALAAEGREGGADTGGGLSPHGLPIMKPPYGQLSAIDLNKGEIIWQVAHGETPENITNNPALKGVTIPRTGRPGTVGQLVTKTLLISGESSFGPTPSGQRGAMLRAYDKTTGKELGALYMPAPQTGGPMSYMLDGKQYIVVWIGGGGFPAELIAFRVCG
jgi:quinoprotein glucose dehydrogenase